MDKLDKFGFYVFLTWVIWVWLPGLFIPWYETFPGLYTALTIVAWLSLVIAIVNCIRGEKVPQGPLLAPGKGGEKKKKKKGD